MRKALIGLMMAATAITPIASAYAQDTGRWRRDGQSQQQTQTPRQTPSQESMRNWRSERQQSQRTEQQPRVERQQAPQVQNGQSGGDQGRQRFQRRVDTQPAPQGQDQVQQNQDRQRSREAWQQRRDSGGPTRRFERRDAPTTIVEQPQQQQVQTQPTRERWRTDGDRTDAVRSGERRWDGNRTDTARTGDRRWDGSRTDGRRDGERRWDGDRDGRRSGSWDGRNYRWNRDGRQYSWNHDWRNNRRYDWQSHRRSNRYIFNLGSYYSPYRNYGYQRFSIGWFLEPLFFGSNYWIGDPWQYRLPPAYPGTRWIRYYDDVLLVDMYTGEVIDVIHNFFW